MTWNWRQPDWPEFRWDAAAPSAFEARFLQQSGVLIGTMKHLNAQDREAVTIDIMAGEAMKTSEIEGELLNRDSVQSSLRRAFGLETASSRIPPAERGIAEMMMSLYSDFAAPLAEGALFAWHRMIVNDRRDIEAIGRYREHSDAMQVVSGAVHRPKIHFEAPPSHVVAQEMAAFLDWFAATAPGGVRPLPGLVRAGVAHLYFVSIHPFEDGNGRIARVLADKALSQAIGQPSLIALSQTIQRKRTDYYDALEAANKHNEITPWLIYFAETALEAQAHSLQLVDFLIAKTRFYDRYRGRMNDRQERAVARIFREGLDGFTGGLSAANYIAITGASRATASRDLQDLATMGALTRTGALKSTRYYLKLDS